MALESESLDLVDYVNEQVLAEWSDPDTKETHVLGSLSTVNKQDAGLSLRIGLDRVLEQAFVRLSMDISVRVSGRPRRRQLLLVLPLHVLSQKTPALEYDVMKTPDLGSLAPAIHDAGLSDSGFVIRAQFNLREAGYVLMPKSNAKALRPSTSTAVNHLAGMMSLSQALTFTLYIKPSDYARQGLRMIDELLRDDTLKQYPLQWDAMYGGHGAQLVDWNQCALTGKGKEAEPMEEEELEPPPPYVSAPQNQHPRTPSPPAFEFPPSPAFIPPFLLSPTQYSSSPEIQVERSTWHSSPSEVLSTAESLFGSGAYTIPATPDCLPEIRALLDAQAAARQEKEHQQYHHPSPEPPESCRKRRATSSPAASPSSFSAAITTTYQQPLHRPDPPKRVCTIDTPDALHPQDPSTLTTAAPILLSPLPDVPTPAFPSTSLPYAALHDKLFPNPPAKPTTANPPTCTNPPAAAAAGPPTLAPAPQPAANDAEKDAGADLPDTLMLTIATWTSRALALNPRVYRHSQLARTLLALGKAARESDLDGFRRLRARAGAAFFFDPADEGWRDEGGYVGDMEGVLGWMLEVDGMADVVVWGEMVALGAVARGLVGRGVGVGEREAEEYRWRKAVVVSAVCVALGG